MAWRWRSSRQRSTGPWCRGGSQTRFDFGAEIDCEKQGTYEIAWTATIKADQVADATNDKAKAVTTVVCKKKGKK